MRGHQQSNHNYSGTQQRFPAACQGQGEVMFVLMDVICSFCLISLSIFFDCQLAHSSISFPSLASVLATICNFESMLSSFTDWINSAAIVRGLYLCLFWREFCCFVSSSLSLLVSPFQGQEELEPVFILIHLKFLLDVDHTVPRLNLSNW